MTIRVGVRSRPDRENLQLYYTDPLTGRDVTKSAGTDNVRKAERVAAEWEAELAAKGVLEREMSWEVFRVYYEDTHLASKSPKTASLATTAMNWFEKSIGKPKRIDMISSLVIARLVTDWRERGIRETTIASYLRQLRAALGWAHKMRLIRERPVFAMPSSSARFMRGRPINIKECRVLLQTARAVRPSDWRQWVRFLRGLWYSGLRLEEAIKLSWTDPPLRVDLDGGKYPRLIIHHYGQKSRKDEVAPLAPDFATWLRRTPSERRVGRVLPIHSTWGSDRLVNAPNRVGRILSEIGTTSKIVVNEEGKHVSAHDMRRSFGTRWAARVKPLTLKRLMRHASIETTLRYYVEQDADDVAEELWAGELYPQPCTANVQKE